MRPDELRVPPLGLVLALGRPDLHEECARVLRNLKPPLGLTTRDDIADAPNALKARARKRSVKVSLRERVGPGGGASGDALQSSGRDDRGAATATATTTASGGFRRTPALPGMIKRSWLKKHKDERPVVVMALIDNEALENSSTTRRALESSLEKLYGYAHNAGASCCVVVVACGPGLPETLPEDKAAVIRRVLRVENRAIVTLNTAHGRDAAWSKAARVAQELAVKNYESECERLTLLASESTCPRGLKVRYAFKAGVYAEFRQDWTTAVRRYRLAYDSIPDVTPDVTPQDVIETLEVSQVLHVKLCVLLLHSGSSVEAVHQIEEHMRRWSTAPLKALPREALPTFHRWRSHQYDVFGDLLNGRLPAPAPVGTPRTHLPAFYFHAAAHCSIERRQAFDDVVDSNEVPEMEVKVEHASFVGQLKVAGTDDEPLTAEQYMTYLRVKDTRDDISRETIELLTKAHDHYKTNSAGTAGGRTFATLIRELANEYLHAGDYESALKLFKTVAVVYRREKWNELLCSVLMNLKTCAKALRDNEEYLNICLEMAALHEATDEHAPSAFAAALAAMNEPRGEDEDAPTITCEDNLSHTFILKAGFSTSDCVPGEPVKFHVALRSNFAGDLDITHIDVDFTELDAYELSDATPRTLRSNEWLKIDFEVIPKCGYVCEANSLTITTVSGYELVLPFTTQTSDCSVMNADYESLPASVLKMKIKTHILDVSDAPPRASISMRTSDGPALVGEMSRVIITVLSVADEIEEGELALVVTEGDKPSKNVQILTDSGDVIKDGKIIVGDIALREKWTGMICLRWTGECPPAALHASLTAKRTGARMTELFKDKPRTAPVENVAQISCDAPFTVKRAYLPAYRQSPLVLQEDKCSKSPPVGVMLATLHVGGPAEITLDGVQSHDTKDPTNTMALATTETRSDATLYDGDAFLHVIPLRSHEHGEDAIRVMWHRTHGDSRCVKGVPTVILNEYCLPNVTGSQPPLVVELRCPPKLFVGDPFTYEVRVSNATTANYDIKISVTDSTGFVFAGIKRGTMYVPPLSTASFYFLLVPIVTGSAILPELSLGAERFSATFVPPIESRRVIVRPKY